MIISLVTFSVTVGLYLLVSKFFADQGLHFSSKLELGVVTSLLATGAITVGSLANFTVSPTSVVAVIDNVQQEPIKKLTKGEALAQTLLVKMKDRQVALDSATSKVNTLARRRSSATFNRTHDLTTAYYNIRKETNLLLQETSVHIRRTEILHENHRARSNMKSDRFNVKNRIDRTRELLGDPDTEAGTPLPRLGYSAMGGSRNREGQ